MRRLPILLMFLLAVSIAPVYAQNVSMDEQSLKIRQEILECEDKIESNEDMTDAEKTVNKRKCTTEIKNKYADNSMTSKTQNEMKIKLQNLQRCDDWYSSYKFLDEATFKVQKNAQMVTSCIKLYNDSLWNYEGEDRQEILVERLDEIMSVTPVKTNLTEQFTTDEQKQYDTIQNLERRITELENELKNKDMIIREQMNVITNLVQTLKNVVFDGIQSVYSHLI